MKKIAGFTELAYGADYLKYALRSILPHIDEYYIAYSPYPTRGNNPYKCPDTRDELFQIAADACAEFGKPLTWWENPGWWGRYDQRNSVWDKAGHCDLLIITDADEVWADGAPEHLIKSALAGNTRFWRLPYNFLWRSFNWHCEYRENNVAWPLRATRPDLPGARGEPSTWIKDFDERWMVHEFGFARKPRDFFYKLPSHGHFRNDQIDDWFTRVWLPWNPETGQMEDVHPYRNDGERFPRIEPFDRMLLPEQMREHPYWDMSVIGGDIVEPPLERLGDNQ